MTVLTTQFNLRQNIPDFRDLPWEKSLADWPGNCDRLEDAPHGVHRHPVVFVNYSGVLYALKELPASGDLAAREDKLLTQAGALHIPAVKSVGYVSVERDEFRTGVLITRYLEGSLPYRILLSRAGFEPYRKHLLDAMAGLLVEIHLCGMYWGDCSLSNTLFRRDAGALRAYVVDLETAEIDSAPTRPTLRFHDLQIMDENVNAEIRELLLEGLHMETQIGVPLSDIGGYIRVRYSELWDEVNREDVLEAGEHYRIQERVRNLNRMGFSVGAIDLVPTEDGGDQLILRVIVSDRNFHRDQLFNLTGLDAEEMQARKLMNEIQEVRAWLSNERGESLPLAVAAHSWLNHTYRPVIERLQPIADSQSSLTEYYCQILEHKWYLSEKARHDVGHMAAVDDYLRGSWFQKKMDL